MTVDPRLPAARQLPKLLALYRTLRASGALESDPTRIFIRCHPTRQRQVELAERAHRAHIGTRKWLGDWASSLLVVLEGRCFAVFRRAQKPGQPDVGYTVALRAQIWDSHGPATTFYGGAMFASIPLVGLLTRRVKPIA